MSQHKSTYTNTPFYLGPSCSPSLSLSTKAPTERAPTPDPQLTEEVTMLNRGKVKYRQVRGVNEVYIVPRYGRRE